MNTPALDPSTLTMRMSVSFAPSQKTALEIHDAATACGASVLNGGQESGVLVVEASGNAIGAFRDAMTALGLSASFIAR